MIQPANAASVEGDFSRGRITLRGQPFQLRVANGVYFITESNITGTPRERMLAGDLDQAAAALQIAMDLEADRPSVRFLLGWFDSDNAARRRRRRCSGR